MEFSNPVFNAVGTIDCDINHPDFGWIPYTCSDVENPEFYAELLAAGPAAYVPQDPAEILASARAIAFAPREDFCNRCADLGILSDAEAIAAAKGEWPAPMAYFLAYLDAKQQRDAQVAWASCATVQRTHWAVLAMVSTGVVTEEQADTLCGI